LTTLLYDDGDLQALARAWQKQPTFAWLSRRNGVTEEWLQDRLATLPQAHRDGCFALLTSGTTGEPKLVVGCRRRSEALARLLHTEQELEPVAETVVVLPLTYTYAFVNQWLWSLVLDRKLVRTEGLRDVAGLAMALERCQNAMVCLVGAQLPLMRRVFSDRKFPGVIRLHFAGGAFPQSDLDFVRAIFPNALIYNNYGCAEAMPRLTLRLAGEEERAEDVGPPLPGIRLRCDAASNIQFQSPFACVGQVDEGGFHAFGETDWIATGDLGAVDARGHLVLSGRNSEVFKRYGEKVSLAHLQRTVQAQWTSAVALYREVDSSGEPGHVLLLSPAPERAQVRAILRALRAHHPRAWWPLRVEGVEKMPLLANGKVDVRAAAALPAKVVHWNQRI